MPVTLRDVAMRAGVSRSAVSRAYTDGASVSARTRAKVEAAARELGYTPSFIARSLTTKRTKLIGLVANNFQNPAFLEVFDLYTRALQARALQPLLVNLTATDEPEQSVRMLRQYSVDGVIVATSTLPDAFSRAFHDAQVPVVHAFGRFDAAAGVHVVGIDNIACGRMAAKTLVARRYERIAVIGGPGYATSTQDRIAGFVQHLAELGHKAADISYAANYSYDAGRDAMRALLDRLTPDVVFCGDDLICMGAMDAARARHLSIPQDIGFLGFNDISMASWEAYGLTTIHQPIGEIILASVALAAELAEDRERPPAVRLFDCSIVERRTLRPVA